jgi:hypothetical protein
MYYTTHGSLLKPAEADSVVRLRHIGSKCSEAQSPSVFGFTHFDPDYDPDADLF